MGIEILATAGTCKALRDAGVECTQVAAISEAHPNIGDMIASGTIDLVINTPTRGRKPDTDGSRSAGHGGALCRLRHRHRHRQGHAYRPGAGEERRPAPHRHHQNLTFCVTLPACFRLYLQR